MHPTHHRPRGQRPWRRTGVKEAQRHDNEMQRLSSDWPLGRRGHASKDVLGQLMKGPTAVNSLRQLDWAAG